MNINNENRWNNKHQSTTSGPDYKLTSWHSIDEDEYNAVFITNGKARKKWTAGIRTHHLIIKKFKIS